MLAFPNMKRRQNRQNSLPSNIVSWAKKGMFMDGDRRVCCFCCGFCTASWSVDDNPWKFHGQCDFASFNSGFPLPATNCDDAVGDPRCIVCFEKKIATLNNCGHAVCCRACSLQFDFCPWCRSKVSQRTPIFLP